MVAKVAVPVRRRRRGLELEAALLVAAWEELVAAGYAHLTMESIARRAGTSEAVLYRRWPNKDQLVVAALQRHRRENPVALADTGALRTDLIAQLTALSEALAGFLAIAAAAAFSGLLSGTGLTPAEVREQVMGGPSHPQSRALYQRAHERGELDVKRVPAAVLAMPFDLVRHDLLMNLAPPKPARIRAIVDELFLPLVRAITPRARSSPRS